MPVVPSTFSCLMFNVQIEGYSMFQLTWQGKGDLIFFATIAIALSTIDLCFKMALLKHSLWGHYYRCYEHV